MKVKMTKILLSVAVLIFSISIVYAGVNNASVNETIIESLIQDLADQNVSVKVNAVKALVEMGEPVVEPLIQALKDNNPEVRENAAQVLGKIGDERAVAPLIELLADEQQEVRKAAQDGLANIGESAVIERANASNEPNILFEANQTNIESITKQLTDYGERRPNKVNTSHAANYIKGIMLQTGLDTSLEKFYYEIGVKSWNVTGINVVGIKKGNMSKGRIILVIAHYDSAGGPGADDNAAGVAAMLEAARALQNKSFNKTIYFIAFSGEEDGCYGSKAWISEHKDLSEKIVAVINLDYIGKNNIFINYIPQYGWLKDILNQSAKDFDVPIGQDERGWVRSDHATFWDNHIPAVEITHSQTDPYIHTEEDTIDKVDFSAVKDAAKIIVQSIYYLDGTGDDIPPSVNITIPENNSTTCEFNLTYDISNRNSAIEVFLDNSSLGNIKSGHRFTFTKGNHTIKVLATDDIGNTGSDNITFSCNETYNLKIKNSSISATTADIISSPSKENSSKSTISQIMTNIVRLEYNYSYDTTIFLDGIGLGYIESGHLFVLDSGIHTFEVYNEKDDGTIDSDSVTFEVGYNPPVFDDLALNKQNENNTVSILAATFMFFAIIIVFKKIKN